MPERVELLPGNKTCLIESWGEVTETDLKASLDAVVALAKTHPLIGILVDATRLNTLPPVFVLLEFASLLSTRAGLLKHAVVISNRASGRMDFVQLASNNRGVNLQIFTTRHDAFAWLKRQPDAKT